MSHWRLRYLGHRAGRDLADFTGAAITLIPGETFDVPAQGLVIGRGAGADLRVASALVALRHARVWPQPDGLHVADLGNTGGTSVNEAQVGATTLRAGNRLTLAARFDFLVLAAVV